MTSRDLPPLASSWWAIFFSSQLRHKAQWPPIDTDLSEKVAIVTGANTGLGFECARQLLSFRLSRLVIAVRSEEKGKAAATKLRAAYPNATVMVWLLDLCSYNSIQNFVGRVESQLPRLDIAILNSGLSSTKFRLVPETGHEELLQVNYLSTVLLSLLLLPVLKDKSPRGKPGRLSIVNSGTSLKSTFPNSHQSPLLKSFDNIKTAPLAGLESYGTSKLLCHMFVYKLVDYVSADDVVVNIVDPGMTKGTEFGRDLPKILSTVITPFASIVSRNVAEGASTYLDAAVVKGKESHGCFVMDWQIRP